MTHRGKRVKRIKVKKTLIRKKQEFHTMKRSDQRYNLKLNSNDYRILLSMIQREGSAKLLARVSCTRALFLLDYKGRDIYALYNKKTNRICTFLTKEYAKEIIGDYAEKEIRV